MDIFVLDLNIALDARDVGTALARRPNVPGRIALRLAHVLK
ncbi:MAG: hypothetical protein R3C71_07560 [Candidatus Krumholzibacteriia bacterium]